MESGLNPTTEVKRLTDSDEDLTHIHQLWNVCFPDWPIAKDRLSKLLFLVPGGHHYIHKHGFCLSFLHDGVHGKLAAIAVVSAHDHGELGGWLFINSFVELGNAARASGARKLKSFEVGSTIPRFWPQMPMNLAKSGTAWVKRRGFRVEPGGRDMFKDIRSAIVPPQILKQVENMVWKCLPWTPELEEECLAKQRALFSWSKAYEYLAAYSQHHEAMVAFDPDTNAQVGWTLMCSPTAIISDAFAFLPLMPSKEKTGLIAAVGVDKEYRGRGVGLALMVSAMQNMRARGVDGVFVDDVHIDGFYEKLGFETHWQYERCVNETEGWF